MSVAPFLGRETELEALEAAWRAVRAGEGPRAVVLLAERGLGKTRLVQAFYERVVAQAQPDGPGYWPAALAAVDRNLAVGPEPGTWRVDAPMPLLWWALRLVDPAGRNAPPAGVLGAHVERDLIPHLDALHREQRRRARRAEALGVGRGVVVDAIADAALGFVPFGGLLKTLGETGRELHRIAREERRDRGPTDAEAWLVGQREGLVAKVLTDLDALLSGPAGARVPAVVVLDDAQFSTADPGVGAFVEALLPAMQEGGWPLLLVVAHWEREWHAAADGTVAAALHRWGRAEVLRLGPLPDLTATVRAAFPGLPDDQARAVADRAGGNPRLLDELLRHLGGLLRRAWFEGRDPTQALTPAGLAGVEGYAGELHDLVAQRFAEAPDDVQVALALAAAQGAEFLPALAAATGAALEGLAEADLLRALEAARTPHAFVEGVHEAVAAFVQRVGYEVARSVLGAIVEPDRLEDAVRVGLRVAARADLAAHLEGAALERFLGQLAATFEGAADAADRSLAARALTMLIEIVVARDDLVALASLAPRLADAVAGLDEQHLLADLGDLRAAAWATGRVGDRARQSAMLARWFELVGAEFEAVRDDPEGDGRVDAWTGWMAADAATAIGDRYHDEGDGARAIEAYAYAHAALGAIEGGGVPDDHPEAIAVLDTGAYLSERLGAWTGARGRSDAAAAYLEHALAMRTRLATLDPAPARALARGRAWAARARLAWLRAEPGATDLAPWWALADDQRAALPELGVDAEDALATTLAHLALLALAGDDLDTARAARREVRDLRRARREAADAPSRRVDEALACLELAAVDRLDEDLGTASSNVEAALELLRPIADGAAGLGDDGARRAAFRATIDALQLANARRDGATGRRLAAEALARGRALGADALGDAGDPGDAVPLELRVRWLAAIAMAAPHAAAEGPAQASAHFAEADAAFAAMPDEARWLVAASMADLEEVRARWFERAGDAAAAAAARDRAEAFGRAVDQAVAVRGGAAPAVADATDGLADAGDRSEG